MSFYFTNEEIRNLVSYFFTTTNWLCLNNCKEDLYPKIEDYCLICDISKRFLNCYRKWMTDFLKKSLFEDSSKVYKSRSILSCPILLKF